MRAIYVMCSAGWIHTLNFLKTRVPIYLLSDPCRRFLVSQGLEQLVFWIIYLQLRRQIASLHAMLSFRLVWCQDRCYLASSFTRSLPDCSRLTGQRTINSVLLDLSSLPFACYLHLGLGFLGFIWIILAYCNWVVNRLRLNSEIGRCLERRFVIQNDLLACFLVYSQHGDALDVLAVLSP